ncbi:hypothetical protein Ssi02_67010 [Sinosporangium siamense]|uniref:Alpha-N-acetylglucosaminidase tim-barrel domain-containing protein n=1 Tax=Sinosporangium siamense TaxID=1367973 RepID=A0A919RP62_9ACTN|nr:alpha-N-acetylglucosaminidase TIM-barrel domain-containing protein [Sinosporangium siamense]GII96470.1 hypothetical protein Ssi02_67010 [Sinosporangium siamense]
MPTHDHSFTAAATAISRLSGLPTERIVISPMPAPENHSAFAVDAAEGRLRIRASDNVAAVSAYSAYARRTGLGSVSRFGVRPISGELIEGPPIEMQCEFPIRLAHNITVGGYTTPYFDWDQWQRELDLLAASGINTVQLTLGQEAVWLNTFQRFGYRQEELLDWIAPPSHQPWQWLNNIEYFGEGTSLELIERRVALAGQVLGRMRELGMRAVLPGFSGTVPRGFTERNPGAHTVPQGKWFLDIAGPERPDWLAGDTQHYDTVADVFYAEQTRLFNAGGMWAVDLLHEGGKSGGVPLAEAARGVEAAMRRADPNYTWVVQAWVGNPRRELLEAVDREHLLVLDLTGESWEGLDAFDGAPWVYGILPNYGGRTSLYGDLAAIAATPVKLGDAGTRRLKGLTNMAEGVGNHPVVWDLFHEPHILTCWHGVRIRPNALKPHIVRQRILHHVNPMQEFAGIPCGPDRPPDPLRDPRELAALPTAQEEIELRLLVGDVVLLQGLKAVCREAELGEEAVELRIVKGAKHPPHLAVLTLGAELVGRAQQHLGCDLQGDLAWQNVDEVGEGLVVDRRPLNHDLAILRQIDSRTAIASRLVILAEDFELHGVLQPEREHYPTLIPKPLTGQYR